jgi:alpha 1,2-mannosyltransferase
MIQLFEYVSFVKRILFSPKCLFNYDLPLPKATSHHEKYSTQINACILLVLRNSDLCDLIKTVLKFEKNFNRKYNYPYVLLSNELFSDEFKQTIVKYTQSKVEFGLISKEEWSVPSFIDETKLKQSINKIGKSVNYRHMCRYFSGFFFRHELTLKYDYYMRLDPHVNFECEVNEDLFSVLVKQNKSYGFVLSSPEGSFTIPTLWSQIMKWHNENAKTNENNSLGFVSNDNGRTLKNSLCIFYNNFEMGSFSLFRNQKYLNFFKMLDKTGGFYHERWGDAPVHTYYALLNLRPNQIHRFKNLGYNHQLWTNWPKDDTKCDAFKYPIANKCVEQWDEFRDKQV